MDFRTPTEWFNDPCRFMIPSFGTGDLWPTCIMGILHCAFPPGLVCLFSVHYLMYKLRLHTAGTFSSASWPAGGVGAVATPNCFTHDWLWFQIHLALSDSEIRSLFDADTHSTGKQRSSVQPSFLGVRGHSIRAYFNTRLTDLFQGQKYL